MTDIPNLRQLIQDQTQGSSSQQILWERFVTKGLHAGIDEATLGAIIEEFNAPTAAERLVDLMAEDHAGSQAAWDAIGEHASLQAVDFRDYLKALEVFLRHPKTQNCKTTLNKIMGYLACSNESGVYLLDFPSKVEHMLDEFGFANQ